MWIDKKNVLTILIGLLIVVVVGVVLNVLTPKRKRSFTSVENLPALKTEKTIKIIVRRGYCLSEIAQDLGSDWQKMAELNKLKNPNFILPGWELKVRPFSKAKTATVSWYGKDFHGKTMSNKKTFDMNDPEIAAHKWLPFGTRVRLTRFFGSQSQKSIVVVVKDRGPYVRGRYFDISRAAAEKLGIIELGIARCRVEILD